VGAPADLISLDTGDLALADRRRDTLLDAWIFAARNPVVDCVWVGGDKLVCGGWHRERRKIAARYRTTLLKLLA
jgi:cytosine/adenosine deaminase-related metal-dependent hydrolase